MEQDTVAVIIANEYTVKEWISNPTSIVAIAAVVVSFAGLLISGIHNRRTLKRAEVLNERSVEPEISLRGDFAYQRNVNDDNYEPELTIRNSGVGPARLKDLKFIFENEEYSQMSSLIKIHFSKLILLLDLSKSREMIDIPGTTLAQNEDLVIFKLHFGSGKIESILLVSILQKIQIRINYTSINGKKKVLQKSVT